MCQDISGAADPADEADPLAPPTAVWTTVMSTVMWEPSEARRSPIRLP